MWISYADPEGGIKTHQKPLAAQGVFCVFKKAQASRIWISYADPEWGIKTQPKPTLLRKEPLVFLKKLKQAGYGLATLTR
ncbi:MAG: hypothetical protein MH137_07365, partial [Flavobacteriales bacterium]|nr:hypothetical protein [Flavobacteriales bacterium]